VLHVHRATRADALVSALGGLLADAPADPFAPELVGVPTRGVERWLTQSLASHLGTGSPQTRDGIVANVSFPSPREIVDQAVAQATGVDPGTDAWKRERTVWPLLQLIDEHLAEPWLEILKHHLEDSGPADQDQPRRLVAVRHLAHLFDRYALHRPQMLIAWAGNRDEDGSGNALPEHTAWQAELWRRLAEKIEGPDPATRLKTATQAIEHGHELDLPQRLSLFGLTRLPQAHLQVLRAIATTRDVHLFALHPSPKLWQQIKSTNPTVTARADDPTATLATNRLLASWGRDARELQLVLGDPAAYEDHAKPEQNGTPKTLLERLQQDIRDDAESRPHEFDDGDDSVQLHSCHGRARQVEVLKDAILHALNTDKTLQPRDVIVMCPDIETFAPLIQATFGVGDTVPHEDDEYAEPEDTKDTTQDLRVRLADRALRQTNPVLGALGRLLELADQRLTATQVLDFADRGPVRHRFKLQDDDLTRLEDWIAQTETRWGLDAPHRAPFKLDKLDANTWRRGLDRVLLGVTMTEDEQELVHDTLPLDDVESGAIDLAGRFAELLDRLTTVTRTLSEKHTIAQWAQHLTTAADLLTSTHPKDAWQRDAVDRLLTRLEHDADENQAQLDVSELRDLLDEHLRGRPTRANFRTGHLTFCTLQPMRSVPHRVVCLLGLDDTVFPRKAPRDGDDLIVGDPHVGDHDGRTEDRQMLLDALLAARDRLIITYSGHDERTNAGRPPAVPVGELLDVIERTAPGKDITTVHPLQPFDPRNFHPDAPLSFDTITLQGAKALTSDRQPRPPFLDGPLPPSDAQVLELDDLIRFVEHPARAFLRQRLGVRLTENDDELKDALPIDLDGLEQWAVGTRMLKARLQGATKEQTEQAERARGALPPGHLADPILKPIERKVAAVVKAADEHLDRTTPATSLDARVTLDDGRVLGGTVPFLHGDQLQVVLYSRVGPKHRLANWVRLLVLTAAHPHRSFEAVVVGRTRADGSRRSSATVAKIPPLGAEEARTHLHALVAFYDAGLREPPPLACATSAAYAQALAQDRNPEFNAAKAWESAFNFPKEDAEPEHRQLFGGVLTFAELLESQPGFAQAATALWSPLLEREDVSDR
jgi:exodeoxyribonuclease V gamma subunit